MVSREQSISNFIKYIDDVINSNYILADKKISVFLRSVSSSQMFMELFEFCTEGLEYEQIKKQVFVSGESYGIGKYNPPINSQILIGFSFAFLCEIDSKEINFSRFLETYFFTGNFNDSYLRFTKEFIVPFKNQVLHAIKQMIEGEPSVDNTKVVVKKAEKPVLDETKSEVIKNLLNQSKSTILQYKMANQPKAELLALYEGFLNSLYGTSADAIKLAFLGYKYCTLSHRKLDVSVGEIEIILIKCGILDEFE